MKIHVDADACPVKKEIITIAKKFNIPVSMYIDTSHELYDNYASIIQVDKGRDSVDIALINDVKENDIVVSQDYGVAAMALGKKAHALNQNGLIYTKENIDRLLMERHMAAIVRKREKRYSKNKKRIKSNDTEFSNALFNIIRRNV